MKRYRYLLDGNLFNNSPIGWDKLKYKIHFVPELNARLLKIEAELRFHGDMFRYLLNQYNTVGHCGLVNIEIQEMNNNLQTYRRVHQGYLRISMFSIDRKVMTISCPVEDNSFYARINNNKSIETFPFATLSKNNVTITKAPFSYVHYVNPPDCSVFPILLVHDDADGVFYDNAHYRVFDLFRYLVDFMGDGQMDFASTLFDTGGDYAGLMVTCGEVIRLITTGTTETAFKENFQKLSYVKLFTEVNKKVNIGMRIEIRNGRPTLVIERDRFFRQTTTMHTCDNIDKVTESINVEKLYSKVRLGSTTLDNAASLSFPESISLLGFKDETFPILGECNIDRELNLSSEFIISSNVIEDMVVNGADSYNTNFVFIMTEPYYANWITKTGNVFGDAFPCQYNLDLTNVSVTQNWLDGIPNSMVNYIGSPIDLFKARNTLSQMLLPFTNSVSTTVPIEYDDDTSAGFFDTNGDYDAVTDFDFTSPADASYSFRVNSIIQGLKFFTPSPDKSITLITKVKVYDAGGLLGGNLISTTLTTDTFTISDTAYNYLNWYTPSIYIQAGYRAVVEIDTTNNSWDATPLNAAQVTLIGGSYWHCIGSQQGGIVQGIDFADYPVILHQFEQELTPTEFDNILADSRGLVECSTHRNYRFSAWLEELEFERATGKAKWKLYSTKNLNG